MQRYQKSMDEFKVNNNDISGTVKKINKSIEQTQNVFNRSLDKIRNDLTSAEVRIKKSEVELSQVTLKCEFQEMQRTQILDTVE